MKAEIISIGTELLLGDIVNTNAQYLARELAMLGIDMYHQQVIGDNEQRILEAFEEAYKRCDIIITTGGLGPTQDDLTKEVAAKYFNKKMLLDSNSLEALERYFNKQGKELKGNNKKQAYFPENALILSNPCGTAPGAIIEEKDKIMIILPGPPREMTTMYKNHVVDYLKQKTDMVLKSKVLRIFGIGESYMAEMVGDIIDNSKNPTVAPYAKENDVTLRITAKGKDDIECDNLIAPVEVKIRELLGTAIYGEGETSLELVVGELLCNKKLTIATAESCTGGMIAAKLISYPGISEVFKEGAVTYANEAKIERLGVKPETLDKFGAVSEETAKEMAIGIATKAKTDIGIISTGIAGPGGGTEEKPVGLVYIGLYINGEVIVRKFNFQGDRDKVRTRATMNALDLLRREINSRIK